MAGITTTVIAAIGLGLTVKGQIDARSAAKDQRKAVKEQNRIQQGQAAIERRRQQRQATQARRLAFAQQEVGGAGAGALNSSGFAGARSSLTRQSNVNLAEFSTQALLGQAFNRARGREGSAILAGTSARALSGFGSNIFGAAGGFHQLFGGVQSISTPTDKV
jgi:hypothetical protein